MTRESFQRETELENIVLVEVSKVEYIKAAYPNYFGDVGYFYNQLRRVVQGKGAQEFSRVPVTQKPRKPRTSYRSEMDRS